MQRSYLKLRQLGFAVSFSLLCERSDAETYAHTLTRYRLWPDFFPAPGWPGESRLEFSYQYLLEFYPHEYAAECDLIHKHYGQDRQALLALPGQLARRLQLRRRALKFLRTLLEARARVMIYSPMCLGANVIPEVLDTQLVSPLTHRIEYFTNGVGLDEHNRAHGYRFYPRPCFAFRQVRRYFAKQAQHWFLLTDQPYDAKMMGLMLPDHFTIGCCDPTNFPLREIWEECTNDLTTRGDIFAHALALS